MRIGRLIIGAAVLSYGAWAVGGMGVSPVLGAESARAAGQQPEGNKRVKVRLLGAKDVQYDRTPLSFGVPFADGELGSDTPVRLVDAGGRASTSGRRTSLTSGRRTSLLGEAHWQRCHP